MRSDKASARYLVELARQHGVGDAVICHGSRNAPLILSLNEEESLRCYPLADERVAAFFALGIAQRTGSPVIVACSSGTATLNMAPAAAEAYYQRIPLLLLTADRPDEWIDQMDGQTIRQERVFEPHVRHSVQLPLEPTTRDALWHTERSINEALNASLYPIPGPAHINVPFREPLYEAFEGEELRVPKAFTTAPNPVGMNEGTLRELEQEWEASERIMLLVGEKGPHPALDEKLDLLSREQGLIVLAENLSNLDLSSAIHHIDRTLKTISQAECPDHAPDLLISIGGAIVSKKVKAFLRENPPRAHWRVDPCGEAIDTYQSLTRILPIPPGRLFDGFMNCGNREKRLAFRDRWLEKERIARECHNSYLQMTPWSDLKAFDLILRRIPGGGTLHAGNSSPVRYLQLIQPRPDLLHRGNRGTSGIDGVISTAAGSAARSEGLVTGISGDIGFFYDSNALWNPHLPNNLRLILINNGGGGIFRIIEGPSATKELDAFFEGVHELSAEGIAKTFGLPYYFCSDPKGLEEGLEKLYGEANGAALLEVRTPREENDRVLKEYFHYLESQKPIS
ncbi:MAG: 2-succinyl-5-enolpyruvyl-6-hydroxy-3-cyclohexene-1-carboxylic-acid synthase [Flavobacteriales bacterium]